MAKPKTLRERAGDYARSLKAMTVAWRNGAEEGYIAGHRAGSRLTKAERKVIEAAVAFARELKHPSYKAEALMVLSRDIEIAVAKLQAKRVRK